MKNIFNSCLYQLIPFTFYSICSRNDIHTLKISLYCLDLFRSSKVTWWLVSYNCRKDICEYCEKNQSLTIFGCIIIDRTLANLMPNCYALLFEAYYECNANCRPELICKLSAVFSLMGKWGESLPHWPKITYHPPTRKSTPTRLPLPNFYAPPPNPSPNPV